MPEVKRKGAGLARPWSAFTIKECGEALVTLEGMGLALPSPPAYAAFGAPYGNRGPYFLRHGVAARLKAAQDRLSAARPDWRIRVFDAYRPLAVQEFMVAHEFYHHAKKRGLDPLALSDAQKDGLLQEVYQFWAPPSEDPAAPPPHSTGAALDCTLEDEKGNEIDMGSPIDFIGPESASGFFDGRLGADALRYAANRGVLFNLLSAQDFRCHPGEWWHFSYGDQIWAWLAAEEGKQLQAVYGRVE